MAFDKDEYRRRRKAGKRGQGDKLESNFTPHFGSNRANYRQKLRAKRYINGCMRSYRHDTLYGIRTTQGR